MKLVLKRTAEVVTICLALLIVTAWFAKTASAGGPYGTAYYSSPYYKNLQRKPAAKNAYRALKPRHHENRHYSHRRHHYPRHYYHSPYGYYQYGHPHYNHGVHYNFSIGGSGFYLRFGR